MQMTTLAICQRLLFVFLAAFPFPGSAPAHGPYRPGAPTQNGTTAQPLGLHLQSLLDAAVGNGLPGVSLRVMGPGIKFLGAAGVADLMTGEPLTTHHVMYVASLGKTFTAAIALQLQEEGRLDPEKPITTWLAPGVTKRIPSSSKITLRHLLNHTSGLIDYLNDDEAWRMDFLRDPHRQWTHADIIPYLYDKPLLFEPGDGYHYANSNYILAGKILEQVTGKSLPVLIRRRILAPLGLKHTFNGHEDMGGEERVHGYVRIRGRIIDTYPWYDHYGLADAGIYSTADDLAIFLKSLFTTGDILGTAMQRQMTEVPQSGQSPSRYGMGIIVQRGPRGTGRWYTHDGIDPGYRADMMYLPDLDLTIVLCANASLGMADAVYERLITAVVGLALDAALEDTVRYGSRA